MMALLMLFTACGTLWWMSPELLNLERFGSEDGWLKKQSDSYALGMVVYVAHADVVIPFSKWSNWYAVRFSAETTLSWISWRVKGQRNQCGREPWAHQWVYGRFSSSAGLQPGIGTTVLTHVNPATWSWLTCLCCHK